MTQKKSYKNEFIRFGFLAVALTVFFAGPRYVQSDVGDDIDQTIALVKASKIPARLAAHILVQLSEDKNFAKENASNITILSVRMSAVNWVSFFILILGLGTPLILKYLENKKVT